MREGVEVEDGEDFLDGARGGPMGDVGCEADIPDDGEMRKERRTLRGVGQIALLGWGRVMLALEFNPAARAHSCKVDADFREKTGHGAKDCTLAAPGRAE
jgi:hypothetical protein